VECSDAFSEDGFEFHPAVVWNFAVIPLPVAKDLGTGLLDLQAKSFDYAGQ